MFTGNQVGNIFFFIHTRSAMNLKLFVQHVHLGSIAHVIPIKSEPRLTSTEHI